MTTQYKGPVSQLIVVPGTISQPNVYLEIEKCLIDTGSQLTLIREKYTKKLQKIKNPEKIRLTNCADQSISYIENLIYVDLSFQNTKILNIPIGIIPNDVKLRYDLIIGLDALTGQTLKIDNNTIQLNNMHILDAVSCENFDPELSEEFLSLKHDFCNFDCIKTCQEKICNHKAFNSEKSIHFFNESAFYIAPKSIIEINIFVSEKIRKTDNLKNLINWKIRDYIQLYDVIWTDDNISKISIQNISEKILYFEKFNPLVCAIVQKWSQTCEFNHIRPISELNFEEQKFHREEFQEWLNKRKLLVQNESVESKIDFLVEKALFRKNELKPCLMKHDWVFSRSSCDIGFCEHYVAELEFNCKYQGEIFYRKPYKMAKELSDEVDEQLKKLVDQGILEITNSSFNTPILAVRKPSGALRIVQNYACTLNDHLNLPCYPIPNSRNILKEISDFINIIKNKYNENVCFSAIDVCQGFHVISQRKSHRKYLSFTHKNTMYRYKKMAQGEKGSPSNFVYLMDTFFSNIQTPKAKIFIYVDDIILVSAESESIEIIDKLLSEMAKQNFLVKPEKCEFNTKKSRFLGYIVDDSGLETIKKKIEKISDYPTPKNLKEAYTFAGLITYYVKFIPRLMVHLAPLHKLIGLGKEKFEMTQEAIEGVETVKKLAKEGRNLYHLDFSRDIFIASDCSLRGIGGAIGNCTVKDGKLHDIKISAYASRSLDLQETLLSSKAREILAAAYCVEEFSELFPEKVHFYLITDHLSMAQIFKGSIEGKTSNFTRIRRAIAILLEKNLTFIFLNNKTELIRCVDGLSRNPNFFKESVKLYESELGIKNIEIIKDINNIERNVDFPTPLISKEKIVLAQKSDPKLSEIYTKLEKMKEQEIYLNGQEELLLKNDLIYRRNRHLIDCLYIPPSISYEIVQYLHIYREHSGKDRVILLINKLDIFIPNKYKLVSTVIRECLFCQYRRPEPPSETKLKEKFRLRPALRPFENCRCDLVDVQKLGNLQNSKIRYVLTFMDVFSKYIDYQLLEDKKAESVATAIGVLAIKYGLSGRSEITFDLGSEFCSDLLNRILQQISVVKLHISGLNPQSNAIERMHREFRRILQIKMKLKIKFEAKIALSCYSYNHLEQANLYNKSPFSILFGFEPDFCNLLIESHDFKDSKDNYETVPIDPVPLWVDHLQSLHRDIGHRRFNLHSSTIENITEKIENFKIGDLVLTKLGYSPADTKKLKTQWQGPFILKKLFRNSCTLECLFSGHLFTRNLSMVKKLHLGEKEEKMLKERKYIIKNNQFYDFSTNSEKIQTVPMSELFHLE